MNNYTRDKRRTIIKEILQSSGVSDQAQILRALQKKRVRTTQATISRDLREMGFVKVRVSPGVFRYEIFDLAAKAGLPERLKVVFKNFVIGIRGTTNLLLIKTSPGNAPGVAGLIDGLQKPEILGTVAGDDTILVLVDIEKHRRNLENELKNLL